MYPEKLLFEGALYRDPTYKLVTGTDPAAGVEIAETVPTGKAWVPLAISFVLATSATVANRRPILDFDNGTTSFYRAPPAAAQTASTSKNYYYGVQAGYGPADIGGDNVIQSIPQLVLGAGYRIRTLTGERQSGDNFAAPALYVVEYRGAGV